LTSSTNTLPTLINTLSTNLGTAKNTLGTLLAVTPTSTDTVPTLLNTLNSNLGTTKTTLGTLLGTTPTSTDTVSALVSSLNTNLTNAKTTVLPLLGLTSSTNTLPTLVNTLSTNLGTAKNTILPLVGLTSSTKTLPNLINEDVKTKIDGLNTTISNAQKAIWPLLGLSTSTKTLPDLLTDLTTNLDNAKNVVLQLVGLTSSTDTLPTLVNTLRTNIDDAKTLILPLLSLSSSTKTLPNLVKEEIKSKLEELSKNLEDLKAELLLRLGLTSSDRTVFGLLNDFRGKLEGERDGLLLENGALKTTKGQNEQTIQGLQGAISQQTETIRTLTDENEILQDKVGDLAIKDQTIHDLQAKVSDMEAARAQTSLEDFVKNANKEITRAREKLSNEGSKYALGRVSLEIKMVPGPGGVGMKFPSMDEMKGLGTTQLSTLAVDFEAQDTNENKVTEIVVPAVLGYTEVMARRKLVEAGLLVDISYQAVKEVPGRTIDADRVVNQVPKAGEKAPPGGYVTIFLGRKS
jgi:hypothetical protein